MKNKLFILGSICLLSLFLYVSKTRCFIYWIFHIPCPTCGMTRAWINLLKGHILEAFTYHPLFLLGPIVIIILVYDFKDPQKKDRILIIISSLFFIVYVLRLLNVC